METLFSNQDVDEIIRRINTLTQDSKAQWGKMNVSRMLAHCTVGLKMTTGEIKCKGNFFMQLIGRMLKNKIIYKSEFRKNSPTAKEFIITDSDSFEEEKNALIAYLKKFPEQGKNIVSSEPHPFFGKLTAEEYDRLQYKHLDHHLRQFGA
ncbi:MAG TPA: DUF1569 domain-containing protein [Ignavibacteria bacterium]|nr:DUF1569 domain-containing protein [Ignavibacteria bacterium]